MFTVNRFVLPYTGTENYVYASSKQPKERIWRCNRDFCLNNLNLSERIIPYSIVAFCVIRFSSFIKLRLEFSFLFVGTHERLFCETSNVNA